MRYEYYSSSDSGSHPPPPAVPDAPQYRSTEWTRHDDVYLAATTAQFRQMRLGTQQQAHGRPPLSSSSSSHTSSSNSLSFGEMSSSGHGSGSGRGRRDGYCMSGGSGRPSRGYYGNSADRSLSRVTPSSSGSLSIRDYEYPSAGEQSRSGQRRLGALASSGYATSSSSSSRFSGASSSGYGLRSSGRHGRDSGRDATTGYDSDASTIRGRSRRASTSSYSSGPGYGGARMLPHHGSASSGLSSSSRSAYSTDSDSGGASLASLRRTNDRMARENERDEVNLRYNELRRNNFDLDTLRSPTCVGGFGGGGGRRGGFSDFDSTTSSSSATISRDSFDDGPRYTSSSRGLHYHSTNNNDGDIRSSMMTWASRDPPGRTDWTFSQGRGRPPGRDLDLRGGRGRCRSISTDSSSSNSAEGNPSHPNYVRRFVHRPGEWSPTPTERRNRSGSRGRFCRSSRDSDSDSDSD